VKIKLDDCIRTNDMPLVTTDDGKFCFLVDTGATFNVLLNHAYAVNKEHFTRSGRKDYLIGMDGDPQAIFLVHGTIPLGGKKYDIDFGVMEETEALRTVTILTGKEINGTLGVDFLLKNKLTIDFATCLIHD